METMRRKLTDKDTQTLLDIAHRVDSPGQEQNLIDYVEVLLELEYMAGIENERNPYSL